MAVRQLKGLASAIVFLQVLSLNFPAISGQKHTMMDRKSLHEYSLAKCSDGSPAAYYIDKDNTNEGKNVMIFLDDSTDENGNRYLSSSSPSSMIQQSCIPG